MAKRKGHLITFEGAEGSGKTTQIRHAVNFLRRKGYSVVFFREPGGTRTSEAIRRVLLNRHLRGILPETELLLYLAARAQLVREKIEPAIKKKMIVVLDRYEDSTLAYQGYGHGIPIGMIREISLFARGLREPDLTFLLDVDTRKGLRRGGRRDRIERKSLAFHRRVRLGFLELARHERKRFVVIPAHATIEEARRKIEEKLNALR